MAVSWSVDGFAGGTGSTGPISTQGVYVPASSIYAGHSVTIQAVASENAAISASVSVKILNPLPVFLNGSVVPVATGNTFLLDVHGTGFVPGSQLQIAGANINTNFVSSNELQSNITLPAGTATLSVGILNPNASQKSPVSQILPVQGATLSPLLMVNPASMAFGAVPVNTASTLKLTFVSTGSGSLTINSVKINGSGFRLSEPAFPVTLAPGAALTLDVKFDPALVANDTGQITIDSNASNGTQILIPLSGTGQSSGDEVVLSWAVPINPTIPIVGYNAYRASSGSVYQSLNDSLITTNTFVDTTVQSGMTYDYYITSVDSSGLESIASNEVIASIP